MYDIIMEFFVVAFLICGVLYVIGQALAYWNYSFEEKRVWEELKRNQAEALSKHKKKTEEDKA